MLVLQITISALLLITTAAEKKIELQDIEEDNLKSEKEKELDKSDAQSQTSSIPLDFLKNDLLRYFENPTQQPRFVQQYAVTEPPERPSVAPKPQYATGPSAQQAMVGYLSNVPMQIYLVPQYYNEASGNVNPVQYSASAPSSRFSQYTAPEAQPQSNYVEVPTYVTPTPKSFMHQFSPQMAYVTFTPQPALASASPHMAIVTAPAAIPNNAAPHQMITYQMPIMQYPTALAAPPVYPKGYYIPRSPEQPSNDEANENEIDSTKHYAPQTEAPYTKSEYPRYYTSRTPIREESRHGPLHELPPPNPLLFRPPPSHLAHLPKALPIYRPLSKPVYAPGPGVIANSIGPRPGEPYGIPYRKRPSSLLESYIPSSLQIEYLKRGYAKDPSSVFDALSERQYPQVVPRHYERGFLPNQMYHTAAGGVTYGHYKRTPKSNKPTQ